MAANAVRVGAPGAPPREAPATGPLASPGVARLVGFVPLAMFGALQWGALLTPKAQGRMLLGVSRRPARAACCSSPGATGATPCAPPARSPRRSA